MLIAGGTLATIAPEAVPVLRGERQVADLDGDGIFDVGDGLVVNLAEPFDDGNGNLVRDQGETFTDDGLDGVPGTGDFGEGNGTFDEDPDRAHWLEEDPLTRIASRAASDIASQRLYMDVGTEDEFGFARHYQNLVDVLTSKGLQVGIQDGFSGNCADLDDAGVPILLVRYSSGHIGVDSVDPEDLFDGDPCGDDTVWERIVSMIGFLNASFPDGEFGPGTPDFPDLDPTGDIVNAEVTSPTLAAGGGDPVRDVVVYRPPQFFTSDDDFPVVYFLGGYGQEPEDFEPVQSLLDLLILTGQLQNMYFVFLPGEGGRQGSFYVNHVVPEDQVPEIPERTSGRYEDSILQDLIPAIEREVLNGRIKE
jgi:hypothetical protein